MARLIFVTSICTLLLSACGGFVAYPLPTYPVLGTMPPSPVPIILSATPIVLTPVITATGTATQTPTLTNIASPTITPSTTPTPTETAMATATGMPILAADIVGCNTSLDITHQMGEVTNAYVTIRNSGSLEAANLCASLSASDEDRKHPDKILCISSLPAGYQVTLKLSVDTGFEEDTSIQVDVTTNEGATANVMEASCRAIGMPSLNLNQVGVITPIP